MNSKVQVFLIVLLALVLGSYCQTIISFDQNVQFVPADGTKVYRVNMADNTYVQFQITTAGTSNFNFQIKQLAQNPFSAVIPANNRVLGIFKFETQLDAAPRPFTGIVSMKYQSSQLVDTDNTVSAIVYTPSNNSWSRRGVLSTSSDVNPTAVVSNTDFDASSDLFFGFIENTGALPRPSAASTTMSKAKLALSFGAVVGVCLAVLV